jgi:hypothetical protein
VSDYGLDDQAIGVRSPAGAKDFSSILCVQNGSETHPASCPMGTGGPFPGSKARPGYDADYLPPGGPFPGTKARPGYDADHSPHRVPRS